jgi:DNA recombination protein RmuC
MDKLSNGKGNLVKQVERLKEMGAKTGKSLPPELLDAEPFLSTLPVPEDKK